MDAAMKRKWVKALRSGKYQQTRGRLKMGRGFCCLGVLCDVISPEGWIAGQRWVMPKQPNVGSFFGLPGLLKDQLGITEDEESQLIKLNDDNKDSFAEIADYIEDYL